MMECCREGEEVGTQHRLRQRDDEGSRDGKGKGMRKVCRRKRGGRPEKENRNLLKTETEGF